MPSFTSTGDDERPKRSRYYNSSLYSGIALGLMYGILFRLSVSIHWFSLSQRSDITFAFLIIGPFVVGFLSSFPGARRGELTVWDVAWLSAFSIVVICAASAVLMLEGVICIIMLLPIGLILSFLGGLLAYLIGKRIPHPGTTVTCLALIPMLLAPIEAQRNAPSQIRTVESQIIIHASPAVVWEQIQSVPPIATAELKPSWAHAMGFPRPIAAPLSHTGVGGVRKATFERDLTFFETVTTWNPNHQLAFSIKADTAHIPPSTLDEHVTIGGPYFDVLDGEYRIESQPSGVVVLRLISHQRLSTDVNGYAGIWTSAIMQNLQTSILQVIQHRCEAQQRTYNLHN